MQVSDYFDVIPYLSTHQLLIDSISLQRTHTPEMMKVKAALRYEIDMRKLTAVKGTFAMEPGEARDFLQAGENKMFDELEAPDYYYE